MVEPPTWTTEQLTEDAETAKANFRAARLGESVGAWEEAFREQEAKFRRLFQEFGVADLSSIAPAKVAEIFEEGLGDALRYLAGPPISEDDLKVLADDVSLAPSRLARDLDGASKVLDIIGRCVDEQRFPWIADDRRPTRDEIEAAIRSSAALTASQRVSTARRNDGKKEQELSVKQFLTDIGMTEVATRKINTLADAPSPGEFCSEAMVGSRKADVPVRLYDGRLMPIECKVSNSSTNSVKRLNNDAEVKAGVWAREFGINGVVPTAVLSGVFKIHNLQHAQLGGLTLFWAHKLERLGEFIESTRGP